MIDPYNAFEMGLTLFFLMLAAIILISVAGIVDSYLDPDPNATVWDRNAQTQANKGVKL